MEARIVAAASWILIAGCSKVASSSGDAASASPSAAGSAAVASGVTSATASAGDRRRYEVKSGIIQMTNSMFENMEQTLYFDDYGARQADFTTMDMKAFGQTIHSEHVDIDADGYHVRYDALKKTGTRQKVAPGAVPSVAQGMAGIDVRHLSDEMKKEMKVETLPPKTIDGKEATGIYAETMGIKVRTWTWKGIALYTETDMSGMNLGSALGAKPSKGAKTPPAKSAPIVIAAKSVQVDVAVPESRFTVPSDVKISDL